MVVEARIRSRHAWVADVAAAASPASMAAAIGRCGTCSCSKGIPAAPMLMAFVLGPMAENAVRQSLVLSKNNPLIFVERPIAAVILGVAGLAAIALAVTGQRRRAGTTAAPPRSVEPQPVASH